MLGIAALIGGTLGLAVTLALVVFLWTLRRRRPAAGPVAHDAAEPVEVPPAGAPAATPAARPAAVSWTRRPAVLAAGAILLLAFGVVLGVLAGRYTGPAPSVMPGMPSMGGMPGMAAGGVGPRGARSGTPGPLPAGALAGMLRAAHASLEGGRHEEAMAAYQAVLRREPGNVEALSHAGLIQAIGGQTDAALDTLDRTLVLDPRNAHALVGKARLLQEVREDYAGAIAAWERFLAIAPSGPDREEALARIREAKARLATTGDVTGRSGAPAPGPPR